jgi:hypothetical protein
MTVALALVLTLAPTVADAQSAWSALVDRTEIKKRFDGGKDEQEAAQIAIVAPEGLSRRYVQADAALRVRLPGRQTDRTTLIVRPVLEYHVADKEAIRKNRAVHQLAPGLTAEYYLNGDSALMPYVTVKWAETRNFLDDRWEGSVAGFASVYSGWKYGPGAPLSNGMFRVGRYTPFVGIEHFDSVAIKDGTQELAPSFSGSFLTYRLFVQWYPFNRRVFIDQIPFAIEVDGVVRQRLTDSDVVPQVIRSLSASATWYFVSRQRVGIGLSGEFGRTPVTNFVNQERIVLALRVKLTPG